MSTMIIMRGLQASGKSTWARAWVAKSPGTRARLNRDDLRLMMHDGTWLGGETESQIVTVETMSAQMLLESGKDVVIDDTNLSAKTVKMFMAIAAEAGAEVEFQDFTNMDVEECIRRDRLRYDGANFSGCVGEEVIRKTYQRYIKGRPYPLPVPELNAKAPVPVEPYVEYPQLPWAILVDMDGTMAKLNGRSAYDETRVSEDLPNPAVIRAMVNAHLYGDRIIVMSGRTQGCMQETLEWIAQHVSIPFDVPIEGLHMRSEGDSRADSIVKSELFDKYVRGKYNISFVLDDRDSVVKLWRSMGLTCFQVDYGNF